MYINSRNSSMRKVRRRPYTLIEIIVVIGIMATLMAVALPSFSAMMKGQGVEGAARNVCQTLKLARTYAINNRKYVAVLFPNANLDDEYHFKSYRVCLVTKDANGNYTFQRWISNENWEFLPTGITIYGIETDAISKKAGGAFSPAFSADAAKNIYSVNCEDIGYGTAVTMKGIIFRPNGRTANTTSDTYIGLSPGTPNGTDIVNTNPDAEPVNIRIGQYTGRVSYGTE